MVSIGTCPQCAAHLALPESATGADHAQCPECRAEFLIAEADQRWLSAATLLDPVDPSGKISPAETVEPIASDFDSQHLESQHLKTPQTSVPDLGVGSALLSGWEDRIKTAIETTGGTIGGEVAGTSETFTPVAAEESPQVPEMVTPETAPKFEFKLDPPAESDSIDSAATATINLKMSPEPPPRKKSLARLAATAIAPGVVGIFLGLLSLLWIKGPEADYLNLTAYLPDAMLPPTSKPETQNMVVEQLAVVGSQTKHSPDAPPSQKSLIGKQEPIAENKEPAGRPLLARDESVRPATAELATNRTIPEVIASAEQFHQTLEAARSAAPGILEGDLTTRDSIARKGKAYMAMCRLAEQFQFVNQPKLSNGGETDALLAKSLFRSMSAEATAQRDLAQITARWWEHAARTNQGIFLIGRIQNAEVVGAQTLCSMVLGPEGEATVIPVLLDRFPYHMGDQVGVVGSIVAQPGRKIPGFNSPAQQIVVAHFSYDLLAPQDNPLKKAFLPYLAK